MTSETFSQTAGQLITNALRDARIIAAEQAIQAKDLDNGLTALNIIIKHWQAQGIHLWSEEEAIVPLVTGQRKYLLGPSGDDIGVASTFFNTTLTTALIANDTVITVASTTGTNVDGQSLSMAGADDILATNPTTTTQDWITGASTIAVVFNGLEVTNSFALGGGVNFELDTTIGITYQVEVDYIAGTSGSADFKMFDIIGDLDTVSVAGSQTVFMEFTARELITTFEMLNGSTGVGDNNVIGSLNYRDKSTGDRIGIEMDDGSRFWDSIVTVDSSTQVTINNGVPSGSAINNTVYTYGTAIARPMRLLQGRFAETVTASEIPVRQWSRDEYFDQPDKDSSGTVVNWYYTPKLTNGELYVWQVANSINQVLRLTYVDVIDIPTDTDDPLDFPSEWYMPLKWAIAAELGPSYGIADNRQLILEQKAFTTLESVLGFDVERESMSFQPDFN